MEYSRVENLAGAALEFPNNARTVKFYVYKEALPSAVVAHAGQGNGRATSANLDGVGERPVPQLCMVCHGGTYANNGANPPIGAFTLRTQVINMGSRFLPFDQTFFTLPAAAPNQEAAFKLLNQEIVNAAPPAGAGDPVRELVDAWYAGGSATQIRNAVVPGWQASAPGNGPADETAYRAVLATCRTCHVTSPFGNVTFQTSSAFKAIISSVQTRVCDQHVMPHAKRTHDLLWTSTSPNMAGALQSYGQTQPGWSTLPAQQCGAFTPSPGPIVGSFYQLNIHTLWQANGCTGCHSVAGAGNGQFGMGTTAGSSYASMVGVNSMELPSMKRVLPSNTSQSYLYHKLAGTQGSVGGSGGQMPLGGGSVSAATLTAIQNWINSGAAGP